VSKIEAQAAADARRVEGQGIAEYQKAIQPTLTPQILRWREIEATKALADSPNTKLVLGGGGSGGSGSTLLDLRSTASDNPYTAPPSK
jgi:regulator of protease activity HflC (stomatin/prohibitin superfamily)